MLMVIRGMSVFGGLAAEVMLVECGVVIVVFDRGKKKRKKKLMGRNRYGL